MKILIEIPDTWVKPNIDAGCSIVCPWGNACSEDCDVCGPKKCPLSNAIKVEKIVATDFPRTIYGEASLPDKVSESLEDK